MPKNEEDRRQFNYSPPRPMPRTPDVTDSTWKHSTDTEDENTQPVSICPKACTKSILPILALVLFIADIGSDTNTAIGYYKEYSGAILPCPEGPGFLCLTNNTRNNSRGTENKSRGIVDIQCMDVNLRCNGHNECVDGSDEAACAELNFFFVTIAVVITAAVVTMILDIVWLCIALRKCRVEPSDNQTTCCCCGFRTKSYYVIQCVVSVASLGVLGRIWRIFEYWCLYIRSIRLRGPLRGWCKQEARNRQRDVLTLNIIEAVIESVPQFGIQLYIAYEFNKEFTFWRVFTLVTSIASIATAYSAYYKINREACANKADVKLGAFIVYLVSVLCVVLSTFIATVFFLVYLSEYAYVLIGIDVIHILVVFFLAFFFINPTRDEYVRNTDPDKSAIKCLFQIPLYLFSAFVSLSLFVNLVEEEKEKGRVDEINQTDTIMASGESAATKEILLSPIKESSDRFQGSDDSQDTNRDNGEGKEGQINSLTRNSIRTSAGKQMIILYIVIYSKNIALALAWSLQGTDLWMYFAICIVAMFVHSVCLGSYYMLFHRRGRLYGCTKERPWPLSVLF